ncbi:Ribonucleoside-diphosphate reductase large subunit [Cucumispora dikerogammari]|nr:Ribonucleoside-diphosphate reductase large subunit [Cucumispora dikerogammari]
MIESAKHSNETIDLTYITKYIKSKASGLEGIEIESLCKKISLGLVENINHSDLLLYIGEVCATHTTKHPNYSILAASCELDYLYLHSASTFSEAMIEASEFITLSSQFLMFVKENAKRLDKEIDNAKDSLFDYFGIKTMIKTFLLDSGVRTFERPQYMFMRAACQIHSDNIEDVLETYRLMSAKYFTHATPTLMRSGKKVNQLSSCFLMGSKDSVSGLSNTIRKMGKISSAGGGLAIHISNYSANGYFFKETNHKSCGIIPKIRVFNEMNRCITQSNNRRGSCAIYIEPWHAEIKSFIELRKNTGSEDQRARDLFLALWVPDLFMKRVISNSNWSLFCPYKCPGLDNTFGKEFEKLYEKYEREGKAHEVIAARVLWKDIISAQIETGNPFIMYKDHINAKSNHSNVGIIKSSNLCTEVVQYSDIDEVAICNLASIGLPTFVEDLPHVEGTGSKKQKTKVPKYRENLNEYFKSHKNELDDSILKETNINSRGVGNGKFINLEKIYKVTKVIVKNLNKIIDVSYYPLSEAEQSNKKLRPTGIGVQGLADVFALLHFPFESKEAISLSRDIAETIYYAALDASCELAEKYGAYEKYEGSPVSKGTLAFDYDKVTPKLFDFTSLRERIKKFGIRNSQLIALMPTATTSILFHYNESTEAFPSNIFVQRTDAGDFQVINRYLLNDLIKEGIWNDKLKNVILFKKGSIQDIQEIPKQLRDVYKTVWEIKMRHIIDMAADRGHYICQSQSMNLFIAHPTFTQMNAMHIHSWRKGLKTGMYYLRTMPIGSAIQFTVDRKIAKKKLKENEETQITESSEHVVKDDDCASCTS